jgi:fructose-1,6-bisphosphatase/inositol monophosphatase family enzyme
MGYLLEWMGELETIIEIVRKASEIVHKEKASFSVSNKENQYDLLTTVDLAVERFVVSEIKKRFPHDAILAEESDSKPTDFSGRVWMVDPIDGTWAFAHGDSGYAIVVGLCTNGVPQLGVLYAPSRNELYFGERGRGSFIERDGVKTRLQVSKIFELNHARMILFMETGEKRPLDEFLAKFPAASKSWDGSMGLRICRVAEGKAEICMEPNARASKWDSCAAQVVLVEAGGKITDSDGQSLNYFQKELKWQTNVVATNRVIHEEVMRYIRQNSQG